MKKQLQYPLLSEEYAVVTAVNHPLITVRGFSTIQPGEVVIFENGSIGQVMSFENEAIQIMQFSHEKVSVESRVSRTGQKLSFPVSHITLGGVFSPLGEHLYGALTTTEKIRYKPLFSAPPSLVKRRRITEQLETCFSLTDIMLPLGLGQRELLVGDRKAGKSDFARGVALAQAKKGTTVVFGLIGKKVADIKRTYDFFKDADVLDKVVLIASTTKDPVSAITITPAAAMTAAEHLLQQGSNVLLILDDMTTHAEFYRELSLLAKRFPGRDSYPGDIFFVHAELLERAGVFSLDETASKQVASLTCLPIVRTVNNDLTDYITSNLISITDGHLLFDTRLFAQGLRPAIDTKLSVTRVGKQTQTALQRDSNQELTSFLSGYRKTKNLTHLGSEISQESQKILKKGDLLTHFLSDSDQQHIPATVRLLILGMIWSDWYENTHENTVKSSTLQLTKQYESSDEVAKKLDAFTQAPTFQAFLSEIQKNQAELRRLCQI